RFLSGIDSNQAGFRNGQRAMRGYDFNRGLLVDLAYFGDDRSFDQLEANRIEVDADCADFSVFAQAQIRARIEQRFGEAPGLSAEPVASEHLRPKRGALLFAVFTVGSQDVDLAFNAVDESGFGGDQILRVCRDAKA